MPSGAFAMTQKGNVVLYLDKDLVEKSKELGFNLSKTFENHLIHLMTQFSAVNSVNNFELSENGLEVAGGEGFEPSTPNLGGWCSIRTELLAHSTNLDGKLNINTLLNREVSPAIRYGISFRVYVVFTF